VDGAFGLRLTDVRPSLRSDRIELVFEDPSAELLRMFSQRAAGQEIDLVVNGRKIATLKLRDAIVGNSMELSGDMSADLRKDLADARKDGIDIRLHQ
jgi:hypothetical protein